MAYVNDGTYASPLNRLTTSFNMFQVIKQGNITGSPNVDGNTHPFGVMFDMLVALLIVSLTGHIYRFINETWPNWLHSWVQRLLGNNEVKDSNVAAVDSFHRQPDELAFDNQLLVVAIERYVSHLMELPNAENTPTGTTQDQLQQQHQQNIKTTKQQTRDLHLCTKTTDDRIANGRRTGTQVPQRAEFHYVPVGECDMATSQTRDAATLLERHYRLTLLPVEGEVVEVEPGLKVRFQDEIVDVEVLRNTEIVARRGAERILKEFVPLGYDTKSPFHAHSEKGQGESEYEKKNDGESSHNDTNEDNDNDSENTEKLESRVLVRQVILQYTEKQKHTNTHTKDTNGGNAYHLLRDGKVTKRDKAENEEEEVEAEKQKLSQERMMDFARRAYAWYLKSAVTPTIRYYYYPANSELSEAVKPEFDSDVDINEDYLPTEMSQRIQMRRVQLPVSRSSFDSLFFREKTSLIRLLEDFKHTRGKFAAVADGGSGMVRQLVILIHGPPGTGKTSVVRCIASMLKRHIVSIPMSLIHTNGALQEILVGGNVLIRGEKQIDSVWCRHDPVFWPFLANLSVETLVYALEDVDTMSELFTFQVSPEIRRRARVHAPTHTEEKEKGAEGEDDKAVEDVSMSNGKDTHASNDEKDEKGKQGDTNTLENEKVMEEATGIPTTTTTTTTTTFPSVERSAKEDSESKEEEKGENKHENDKKEDTKPSESSESVQTPAEMYSMKSRVKEFAQLLGSDPLSPEGFMRVLNSSFAPPGRVVILTTNHPERLPAELFQPGVLTLQMEMGPLNSDLAMQLVARCFPDAISKELGKKLEAFFVKAEGMPSSGREGVMNPSWLEHFAQSHDTPEEMLAAFKSEVNVW